MSKTARGQITIVDLNDGKTVSAHLSTSITDAEGNQIGGDSQIYNTDNGASSPDWTVSNHPYTINPQLFVSGNSNNVVGSNAVTAIAWTINGESLAVSANLTKYGASVGFSGSNAAGCFLKLSKNMIAPLYNVVCTITYHDSDTNLDTTVRATKTITKIDTTGASIRMNLYTPNGYTFHTVSAGGGTSCTELTIKAEMWRGSSIDTTDVSYKWYKDDVEITSANVGSNISGYTTGTLTVKADAVPNVATFRCVITDTDQTSATYNQTVQDAVTLYDMTDPYEVQLDSTTGDSLTPQATSTTIKASIKQGGELIAETHAIYTSAKFIWRMYDKDGSNVKYYKSDQASGSKWVSASSGIPTSTPSVRTVTVSRTEIQYRCTIICEATF